MTKTFQKTITCSLQQTNFRKKKKERNLKGINAIINKNYMYRLNIEVELTEDGIC